MRQQPRLPKRGFTLIEVLMTMVIGSVLILGVSNVMSRTLQARDVAHIQNELTRQSRFALQQLVKGVAQTGSVQLPLLDNPLTTDAENIREQFFPASPPPDDDGFAGAVLAVTPSALTDLDGDGIADADNDHDGLIDEDPGGDTNSDTCSGSCLVDDNRDGIVDNGSANDDDEDGVTDEDWNDAVVFYLSGGNLIQRTPIPWDTDSSGHVTAADYVEEVIATQVSHVRIERMAQNGDGPETIAISLRLSSPDNGSEVNLSTQVRAGSRLWTH